MGAWGLGLQANDAALDAIGIVEDSLPKGVTIAQALQIGINYDGKFGHHGLLGVAEWLLDNGFSAKYINTPEVREAIKYELTNDELETWDEPENRRKVILAFERRLEGKMTEQDKELMEDENRGLFARMNELKSND